MKRIIKISEKQFEELKGMKPLNEAVNNAFSLEALSNIGSFRGRYNYCRQNIGMPCGRGSARVVFQMDDEKILKLALNDKGIAQNSEEHNSGADECGITPKVFDNDTEYRWLVSEYVLPARVGDFKQCFGIDWKTFISFLDASFNSFTPRYPFARNAMPDQQFIPFVEKIQDDGDDLLDWYYYITDYQPPYGDMRRLSSYGMTMRNGKPTIVLLDSGLSDEVYNNYYRKR